MKLATVFISGAVVKNAACSSTCVFMTCTGTTLPSKFILSVVGYVNYVSSRTIWNTCGVLVHRGSANGCSLLHTKFSFPTSHTTGTSCLHQGRGSSVTSDWLLTK